MLPSASSGAPPASSSGCASSTCSGAVTPTPWSTPSARTSGPTEGLAGDLGLGERQLRRRAAAAFGYGPKVLARVLRFAAAVERLRAAPGVPLAVLAVETGYADQAHLTHESRALSGLSPGRLRAALAVSVLDKTPAA